MAKTALIIDDSTTMRQMVAFTLREAGYQVVEAENGQDALDKINAQPVNVVITDLNMPVMDGFTFIQECSSDANLQVSSDPHAHHRIPAFQERTRQSGGRHWLDCEAV